MTTRPIWDERWFQRLLVVLVVLVLAVLAVPAALALIYAVRPVLLPVLIAAALAYAANPVVTAMHERLRMPRLLSTLLLLATAALALAGAVSYLGPKLYRQTRQLIEALPGYLESLAHALAERFELELAHLLLWLEGALEERLMPGAEGEGPDVAAIAEQVVNWLGAGMGVIGSTIGYVTYLVIAGVVVGACLLVFLWRWPRITGWFVPFIPVSRRDRTLEILGKMDASVSGFIRGRLIQALVVAVVLTGGWWMFGVPYALLLGIVGGLLNLIPYAAVLVWPVAIGLAWLDALSPGTGSAAAAELNGMANAARGDAAAGGFDFWWVVFWPSIVYFVAQTLDNWVIEPLVQGQATNLDPLTVLLAVVLGGSVAGLLGLLIAIPTAACGKILCQETLLPWLREWAAQRHAPAASSSATATATAPPPATATGKDEQP